MRLEDLLNTPPAVKRLAQAEFVLEGFEDETLTPLELRFVLEKLFAIPFEEIDCMAHSFDVNPGHTVAEWGNLGNFLYTK